MLVAMMDGKAVYEEVVLTIEDVGGLYAPLAVIQQYV